MKTIKQLLITIAVLLCSITLHAFEVDGIYYDITSSTDLTVEVTWGYIESSGSVIIPSTVAYSGEEYSVTSIGYDAFSGCSGLTSITIPESVTSIGDNAFNNCTSLKDLRIEDGNTTLDLGNNYSYRYYGLFYDCPLETLYLGRNLSYSTSSGFGYSPFYNQDELKSLTISNSVTSIGDNAFASCSGLTSITIPESVTSIGYSAFSGCDNIHSLTINSGVVSIGSWAFSTPDKVIWLTNTPPEGYYYAQGRINYVANEQYTSLDNVHVYPYLSSMFETDGVKYVPVSPSERTCHTIDCAYDSTAAVINIEETVLFQGVEMNVTEVMPFTFYGNSHIKDVSVSHSGNIGNQAFYYCDNLVKVEISNYGDIGYEAFYSCDSLGTAIISNYGNIGESVFHGCSSLKNVTLGNNVSSFGNEAFYQCVSLQEIVIPESIDTISESCFEGCSALANVDLGQGVNVINKYAFQDCSALTNVNLRECVSIIDDNTFEGCSSLSQISIPKSVKEIGDNVFKGCTNLSDIIIEDRNEILSLGSNGSSALFADCPLDSLYIGGKITYETSSSYGYSPFYRNTSLRTVVVTNEEDQIYDNEFYGCSNLKNVIIGDGVESIGDYAFSGCSSLDGFSFGSNLKTIGAEAFSDCTNITSITSHAEVPPTCSEQALDDINKWTCVLKVPQNYASAYQAADQWKEFFYIEDVVGIELFTITYIVDGEVYATEKYAVEDKIIPEEEPVKEGYTFSGWSEIPETMPAEDVTVTGSFSINSYDLVYMIDGEEYKRFTLEFGSKVVPEEEPTKEGYTFSGWSNIPETMPARNVTVTGSFSVNSYDLVYMIDGEEYKRVTLEFGSEIVPEEEPTKEGYTFSGWSEIPETMPAHDVEVTGSFIPTSVSEIATEVSLQINGNNISLSNANNSTVAIYSINGVLVKKIDKYTGEEIALEKGVYIVCVGDKAMKIIL